MEIFLIQFLGPSIWPRENNLAKNWPGFIFNNNTLVFYYHDSLFVSAVFKCCQNSKLKMIRGNPNEGGGADSVEEVFTSRGQF